MNNPFLPYIERGELLKVAGDYARSGPEFHGSCPLCGAGVEHGKQSAQFICWPEHPSKTNRGGGYICRNCTNGKIKSGIDFIMERDGVTAAEAFKALGLSSSVPTVKRYHRVPGRPSSAGVSASVGEAATRVVDSEQWIAAATAFIAQASDALRGDLKGMRYLADRGFTAASIEAFKFGFIPKTVWADWSAWGMDDPGTGKQMPLPRGWVIPISDARGRIAVLKIRRPQEDVAAHPEWGKYFCLKRTKGIPAWTPNVWHPCRPVLVFEGEFDAALVQQEAAQLVNAISTGSTSNCIDRDVLQRIGDSPVFIAMDADEAGRKKRAEYDKAYPDWETVDQPDGFKDAGEAFAGGINLREWVRSFLPSTMLQGIESQINSVSARPPLPSTHTPQLSPSSDSVGSFRSDDGPVLPNKQADDNGAARSHGREDVASKQQAFVGDASADPCEEIPSRDPAPNIAIATDGSTHIDDKPNRLDCIRQDLLWLLSDEDSEWIERRLRRPSDFSDEEYVGLRVARHYHEGGELIPYRHPYSVMDTDGVPAQFANDNKSLRFGLILCKRPSRIVCVQTIDGRDYWCVTPRGAALYEGLINGDW